MSAAQRNASERESEPGRRITLSRRQRARIVAAAAALQRHADHDPDPLALLLAAAELHSIAAQSQAADPAQPADIERQRLKAALTRIADAESGIWGIIAKEALDGDGATPPAVDVSGRLVSPPGGRSDEPPTTLDQMFVRARLRRPAGYLRELIAEAERHDQPELARLARRVLARRAGQRR